MLHLKQGILITIEGIDGSGKSTLAHNLFTHLQQQGFNTALTKEPGDSNLGKEIRELVQTQNIPITALAQYLLFAADRAQHFVECIVPGLTNKQLIISDRMADSSLAYQGYGNKLDLAMIDATNKWTMQNITPDITIFVRIPVEVALERCNNRGALSAYEKQNFLLTVAQGFENIYKNRNDVIIVDGTQSQDILTNQCASVIEQWIKTKNILS